MGLLVCCLKPASHSKAPVSAEVSGGSKQPDKTQISALPIAEPKRNAHEQEIKIVAHSQVGHSSHLTDTRSILHASSLAKLHFQSESCIKQSAGPKISTQPTTGITPAAKLFSLKTCKGQATDSTAEEKRESYLVITQYSKATLTDLSRRLHFSGILPRAKSIPSREVTKGKKSKMDTEGLAIPSEATQACDKQIPELREESSNPVATVNTTKAVELGNAPAPQESSGVISGKIPENQRQQNLVSIQDMLDLPIMREILEISIDGHLFPPSKADLNKERNSNNHLQLIPEVNSDQSFAHKPSNNLCKEKAGTHWHEVKQTQNFMRSSHSDDKNLFQKTQ